MILAYYTVKNEFPIKMRKNESGLFIKDENERIFSGFERDSRLLFIENLNDFEF